MIPTFETKRLILKDLSMKDAPDIFKYASDREVTKYTLWERHKSIQDTKDFLKFSRKMCQKGILNWGVWHKKDEKIIGTIGFAKWDNKQSVSEVGYALSKDYWGQGLMGEALKTILDYTFKIRRLSRVEARCVSENRASFRVLEKMGFKLEETLEKGIKIRNRFRDLKLYVLLRDAWDK